MTQSVQRSGKTLVTRGDVVRALALPPDAQRGDLGDLSVVDHEIAVRSKLIENKGRIAQRMVEFEQRGSVTNGFCQRCDKPIGANRLKVIPYAKLCTECAAGNGLTEV